MLNDLPTELIQLIFSYASGSGSTDADPMNTSLAISQISRRWNAIATATPALWSTINVVVDAASSNPPLNVIEQWLHLSRNHPLTLRLARKMLESEERLTTQEEIAASVMDLFFMNMHRWRAIDFTFGSKLHAPPSPSFCNEQDIDMPLLERITLHRGYATAVVPWISIAVSSPRLTHLTVSQGNLSTSAMLLLCVNWNSITHLSIERLSGDACLHIFRNAPRLVDCAFSFIHSAPSEVYVDSVVPATPLPPVTLAHLEKLAFDWCLGWPGSDDSKFDCMFDAIRAPKLRSLDVRTMLRMGSWDDAPFARFLADSRLEVVDRQCDGVDGPVPDEDEILVVPKHSLTLRECMSSFTRAGLASL
ncbi:hypothetical protein MKEN_01039000 [Mycena kentingensis (nom. inval.)]|nr:hypothetical protein MKEN_01039000 [Mycena kentingensis (nom. inval.)]